MSEPILGIDVSRWNPNLDYKVLADNGVKFAIVKITSGDYAKTLLRDVHIKGFRNVGIKVGAYHWCDPIAKDQTQIDYFCSELDYWKIKVAALDVEQYWADWTEFNYRLPITKFLDPTRISQNAYNMHNAMNNRGFNTIVYSRESFIEEYASPMKFWISPLYSWWAYWVYDPAFGRVTITWDYLKQAFLPKIPAPISAIGAKWRIWQYTGDKFILPGTGGNPIDINLYNGTLDELEKYFEGETVALPTPPEPTIPDPTEYTKFQCSTYGLRIRQSPMGKIEGDLNPGDILDLASNEVISKDGYDWIPVKLWLAKGKTDGNDFGKLL